jgi:hypothetical protein
MLKYKKNIGFAVSFIDVPVWWKPDCKPKTKKCHIFVIFHRKCSIFTTFYNTQRIRIFAYLWKNPLSWQPFLVLALWNLTVCRELAYDNLFIFYWRIYHTVRDFNFMVSKSLTVPVRVNDKYTRIWMARRTLYFSNLKMKTKNLKF